ncbi:lambda exonuclease family protein [Luteolibacter luteus]|uniref:YqaJ viral recombinase family protein n=1 Tax=Luteolibacter luteus TaxID=2728835 RepID=A0A858RRX2_9BACT|nr:lambda exonuclease family protein [Luteolibacter luteus]QJE99099.1 YqaJ viral recombinase family protein [Luteolibacter luteus]
MKIIPCKQRSPEWFAARASCVITASRMTPACAPEMKVRLTKAELCEELDRHDIEYSPEATNAELEALLPEPESYRSMSEVDRKNREILIARRLAEPIYQNASLSGAAWLIHLRDKEERALDFNPAVQRGIALEEEARTAYASLTGCSGKEVGFILHDSGGFGASPDLLVPDAASPHGFSHGAEIKCPVPEVHIEWLLAGTLPEKHRLQVHGSMAVTGLSRWDFFSYCPGEPPLHVIVMRDEFTEQLVAGLLLLHREYMAAQDKLAALWDAAFPCDGKEVAA